MIVLEHVYRDTEIFLRGRRIIHRDRRQVDNRQRDRGGDQRAIGVSGGNRDEIFAGVAGVRGLRSIDRRGASDDAGCRIDRDPGRSGGAGRERQRFAVRIDDVAANVDRDECLTIVARHIGDDVERIGRGNRVRRRAGVRRIDHDRRVVGTVDCDHEQRRIGAAVAVGDGVLDRLRRSLTSIEAVVGRAWFERVAAVGVERQHAAARNRERSAERDGVPA